MWKKPVDIYEVDVKEEIEKNIAEETQWGVALINPPFHCFKCYFKI